MSVFINRRQISLLRGSRKGLAAWQNEPRDHLRSSAITLPSFGSPPGRGTRFFRFVSLGPALFRIAFRNGFRTYGYQLVESGDGYENLNPAIREQWPR
jgi:hypothetical protein